MTSESSPQELLGGIPTDRLTAVHRAAMAAFKEARGADIFGPFVPLLWSLVGTGGFYLLAVPQDAALPVSALAAILFHAAEQGGARHVGVAVGEHCGLVGLALPDGMEDGFVLVPHRGAAKVSRCTRPLSHVLAH